MVALISLAIIVTVIFIVDLVIPDPIPFVDEVMLGFATIFLWFLVVMKNVGTAVFSENPVLFAIVFLILGALIIKKIGR